MQPTQPRLIPPPPVTSSPQVFAGLSIALFAYLGKGHPVLMSMLDAGMTYSKAIELRFIANGWKDVLGIGPGAADYVQLMADRFKAPTHDANQLADFVLREARRHKNAAADAAGLWGHPR